MATRTSTPGKNPSGFSSYSYEVTFGSGTLGINLQSTRSGKGAYVDSFHRPPDNSILPAEQSRYIKLGDLVLEINGEDVSNIALSELPKVIEKAKRPVTIKFERGNLEFDFADVVRDPRKLPWFMQYIVEKYGVEEATHEQAKLMLWLECEQFIENEINVPDGDYSDQAYMILKKFFRPDSSFSLLLHTPEKIRSSMLIALAEAESDETSTCLQSDPMEITDTGNRRGTPIPKSYRNRRSEGVYLVKSFLQHHLYRDAQRWAEDDMKSGSFRSFCSSKIAARMTGHLRYSPPFVKITLSELLGCDKKTVFLLLYLCQLKRHGILHCYELLKSRPEENIEGGIPAIEEMIRIATACVHVLALQEDRSGIEDLWMLTRLTDLVPRGVEQAPALSKLYLRNPVIKDTGYIEALQNEISLSIPISESCRILARSSSMIISEIRECIRELRTTLLRELATEIVPKFFASNEFEILLWELDAHKLYLLSQRKSSPVLRNTSSEEGEDEEDDEVVRSFNRLTTDASPRRSNQTENLKNKVKNPNDSIGPAVPDGAVQRLLRKVSPTLPSTITMHRAPLDLMETAQRERDSWNDQPIGWMLLFNSEGGKLRYPISATSESSSGVPDTEKLKIVGVVPIYPEKSPLSVATTEMSHFPMIPDGIVNFLLPHGRCIHEIKGGVDSGIPSPVLFNMALATRDNAIMYGSTLHFYREESVYVVSPESSKLKVDIESYHPGSKHLRNNSQVHAPSALHRSHRPAPHTPSTFKPLTTSNVNSPTPSPYGEWIGQMSLGFETMKNKSPFFDRFKDGLTTFVGNKSYSVPGKEDISEISRTLAAKTPEPSVANRSSPLQNGFDTQIPPPQRIVVDLHVVYGFSLVTQVPSINAIRGPLSQLATDKTFLHHLNSQCQEENKSTNIDADLLMVAHDLLESTYDSFRSLRHAYHQYLTLLNSRIPSVMRWGGAHDLDARMILYTLTPRNFVTILIAFILEYKIAVVSSKITALTVMGELLKSVIAPLKWSHVYVPLIPKQFNNDILQCPTPFFVGVQREFFDASTIPHDVIILDLDSDACRITSDLAKALYAGRLLADELEKVLRPSFVLCDEVVTNELDSHLIIPEVLRLCKLFIADLLIGVEECCTHAVDHNELVVLFDEAMFSLYKLKRTKCDGSICPHDKGFLEQFMRTQCFSLCVVGNILKKLDPNSRPPSRPSSPFVSIPSPPLKPSPTSDHTALPTTPVQYS